MARIRTVKPEFWSSEQVMELAPLARLAFIGLWNFCDDGGVHPASAKTLKAEVFPSDDLSADSVAEMVSAMIRLGLVEEFTNGEKCYWHVTGWARHQKIDRPTYRYPTPSETKQPCGFDECSSNGSRALVESSPPERSLKEVKEAPASPDAGASVSPMASADPKMQIFTLGVLLRVEN